jgi:serine/threonine-protein kinase
MDSDQWQKIGIIFEEALKLTEPERTEFLLNACGGDSELLAEVRSLIEADTNIPPVLKGQASDALQMQPRKNYEGTIIGNYKIIKQIAEGGMGSVFLAERADGQFEQKVALKIIKPGMNSNEIIKRFHAERQILARLQHPNIARLLDGGLTEDNLPYFTMEYVEGEMIDVYCDKNNLSVDERLKLFSDVCGAIQYAHQNLVIHRDLKPSNIIIKKDGTVKLLDFGIAKVFTEDDSFEQTALTKTGLYVMTPEYASPEQIKGERVTTSTDIYSLGLILYQLLSGQKAYKVKNYSPLELGKIICYTEPQKPSTAIKLLRTSDKQKMEEISLARGTQTDRLLKKLSDDLDNICLTALRKEPHRRYATVGQFEQDITNFLEGKPISARPNTINYRTVKFISRHKIGVTTAAVIFLLVTSLITFYTIQLKQERDKATLEARKANQVASFLKNIFKVSDPYHARGETITARELLEKGAQKINRDLADQPDVKATMLDLIGEVYKNLGLYNKAEPLLKEALAIRNKIGANGIDKVKSLNSLGELYELMGKYDEATPFIKQALYFHHNIPQPDYNDYAVTLSNLAWNNYATGFYDKADSIYMVAINVLKKHFGLTNDFVFTMMNNLALDYHEEGKYDKADSLFNETLKLQKNFYGNKPHPELSTTTYNYAELLRDRGKYDEAEKMFKSSLSMDIKLNGPEHPDVAYSTQGLASVYRIKGKFDKAKKLFTNVLNMRRKFLGNNHPDVAYAIYNVGLVYFDEEKYDSSKTFFEKSFVMHKKLNGPTHPSVAICLGMLSFINYKDRNYKTAEKQIRQSMKIEEKAIGKVNLTYASDLITLSFIKTALNDLDSVTFFNHEALKTASEAMGTSKNPFMAECLNSVAKLAELRKDYKMADSLYVLSLNMHKQIMGNNIIGTINTSLDYTNLLIKVDSLQKASEIISKNLKILQKYFNEDSWVIARGSKLLGEIFLKRKDYSNAEPLLINSYLAFKEDFGLHDFHTKEVAAKLITLYSKMDKKGKANFYLSTLK